MKYTLLLGIFMLTVMNSQIIFPQPIDKITNNHLYFQQDQRVPMTSIALVFHGGGSQHETEEFAGLARMTAKMLFRGTVNMTREAIAKKFELLGADVNADVTETDFIVNVSCFTKNLDEVLALVATVLNEANFPQNEIDIVKKAELNGLGAVLQDPDRVLSTAHNYVLFDGLRFGKFGSRAAINRIMRENIQKYFESVRGTSVLYFTSISNLSKGEIEKKLTLFTDGRKTNGFILKPETRYRNAQGLEAVIFNSPGATNDRFFWSHRGIAATDDRRFDLDLVADALGSGQGLLFDQLRNKNGWCYGAYAFVMRPTTRQGRIAYYSDPSQETSEKLIPEMLRLIQVFPDEKDFQERFAERNNTFKNRYAYQLDLKNKLSNEVNRDRFGVPILTKEEYNKRIDAVTLESAKKVISDVFDAKNMIMVFYGDAERVKHILMKIDPSMKITVVDKEVLVQ